MSLGLGLAADDESAGSLQVHHVKAVPVDVRVTLVRQYQDSRYSNAKVFIMARHTGLVPDSITLTNATISIV